MLRLRCHLLAARQGLGCRGLLLTLGMAVCLGLGLMLAQPLGAQTPPAGAPTLLMTADTNAIRLGEPLRCTLAVATAGYRVVLPDSALLDSLLPQPLERLEGPTPDTTEAAADGDDNAPPRQLGYRFTLTAFDTGTVALPALPVWFVNPASGDTLPLRTDSLPIQILDVPVDTAAGFRDLKDVEDPPFDLWRYLKRYGTWIIGGWLLAAALVALYFTVVRPWLRRRRTRQPQAPPEPPETWAHHALDELEQRKLWQQGDHKGYHTALTDVLRRYLERRFGIEAMERTSAELLRWARREPRIEPPLFEELERVLTLADLVKFAKTQPLPDENERAMAQVRRLVDRMKQADDLLRTNQNPPQDQPQPPQANTPSQDWGWPGGIRPSQGDKADDDGSTPGGPTPPSSPQPPTTTP